MRSITSTVNFGDLIAALYDEISKTTSNKKLQTDLVYLALIDMQVSGRSSGVRSSRRRLPGQKGCCKEKWQQTTNEAVLMN